MEGHGGHQEGGGIPRGTMDDARDLSERFAGEGQVLGDGSRRRVDFGQIIGLHIDPETGVGRDDDGDNPHIGEERRAHSPREAEGLAMGARAMTPTAGSAGGWGA